MVYVNLEKIGVIVARTVVAVEMGRASRGTMKIVVHAPKIVDHVVLITHVPMETI
jgi:hypothetical protein